MSEITTPIAAIAEKSELEKIWRARCWHCREVQILGYENKRSADHILRHVLGWRYSDHVGWLCPNCQENEK